MIIGICGLIGSGKDTIADYLVNIHEFRRDSFAATLKDAVSVIFGWDRDMIEGRTRSSREWREQVDRWWADRLGIPHLTPRWVLQYWGTDVFRNHFHDDIWIASLENKLRIAKDDVVISDCRFPNEIHSIRANGGIVVRVKRGADPEWFSVLEQLYRKTDGNAQKVACENYMSQWKVHASEWSWAGTEFNRVIDNNGTLDELYAQINDLVQDHRAAKVSLAA